MQKINAHSILFPSPQICWMCNMYRYEDYIDWALSRMELVKYVIR